LIDASPAQNRRQIATKIERIQRFDFQHDPGEQLRGSASQQNETLSRIVIGKIFVALIRFSLGQHWIGGITATLIAKKTA
jgi:hypothetical protein